jgi:hypothetical protein
LAREKAELEQQAWEKAEAERGEKEKAEAERLAREKAELERQAREKAAAERRGKEKAEAELLARRQTGQEGQARERAAADYFAREHEQAERLRREEAGAKARAQKAAGGAGAKGVPVISTPVRRPSHRTPVVVAIIVLILLGVLAWYYFSHHHEPGEPQAPPSSENSAPSGGTSPATSLATVAPAPLTPEQQLAGVWKETTQNAQGEEFYLFDSPLTLSPVTINFQITPTGQSLRGDWHEWRTGHYEVNNVQKTQHEEYKAAFAMTLKGDRLVGGTNAVMVRDESGTWAPMSRLSPQFHIPITCTIDTDELSCKIVWDKSDNYDADVSSPLHLRKQ